MNSAKMQRRYYRNNDPFQPNTCTLCPFESNFKDTFQRHLMKTHGLKLKGLEANATGPDATLGRITNDYGLRGKFATTYECPHCQRTFPHAKTLGYHQKVCFKVTGALNIGPLRFPCEDCGEAFQNLRAVRRHKLVCGAPKSVCCQLCPFKTFHIHPVQRHILDTHNLIARPVDEPDFEQALNRTPYVLERAIEFQRLPEARELERLPVKDLLPPNFGVVDKKKENKSFVCKHCKLEFPKETRYYRHLANDRCGFKK